MLFMRIFITVILCLHFSGLIKKGNKEKSIIIVLLAIVIGIASIVFVWLI